jgi:hypothetical protein
MEPLDKKEDSNNPTDALKTLRTFQGDMEETIHSKNESKISILTEQKKVEEAVTTGTSNKAYVNFDKEENKKENILLTYGVLPIVGVVLILVGGGLIAGIYYYTKSTPTTVVVKETKTMIPYTSKDDVILSKNFTVNELSSTFKNQIETFNQPLGSLLYINFLQQNISDKTKNILPTNVFFNTIAESAPGSLMRSFGDTYMAGVYSSTSNNPFIILSSSDYGQTFEGMLGWEQTMKYDLFNFFPTLSNINNASSSPVWVDVTQNNKNMRALKDENNTTVLVYGFFDKNTVAITSNEKVFLNLLNKYINNKLVH